MISQALVNGETVACYMLPGTVIALVKLESRRWRCAYDRLTRRYLRCSEIMLKNSATVLKLKFCITVLPIRPSSSD